MGDAEGDVASAKASRKRLHEDESGDLSEELDEDEDDEDEDDEDEGEDEDEDQEGEDEDEDEGEGGKPKKGKKHEAQKKVNTEHSRFTLYIMNMYFKCRRIHKG